MTQSQHDARALKTVSLPDMGTARDAKIVAWHVSVGDVTVNEQPLVSVETDKVTAEIFGPRAGRILKLHGAPGDRVAVGALLVEFEDLVGQLGETGHA